MRFNGIGGFLPLALALVVTAVPSRGSAIISNLGTGGLAGGFTISGGTQAAAGFTMPSGVSYDLTSATIDFTTSRCCSVIGNNIDVRLFGSSGGNPVGPALVTFTHPADIVAFTDFSVLTVTPQADFVLQPSVTYWLVAGTLDNDALVGIVRLPPRRPESQRMRGLGWITGLSTTHRSRSGA